MARQAGGTVAINFQADGRPVAKAFDDVGKSAARLPEQFSKAATAMTALDGVSGKMGSTAVRVTGNLSQMAALIATGGTFGIAIAGLSAAVGAATYVWSLHQSRLEAIKAGYESLDKVLDKRKTLMDAAKQRVEGLRKEIEYWSKTSEEARVKEIEANEVRKSQSIPTIEAEVKAMRSRQAELKSQLSDLRQTSVIKLRAAEEEIAEIEMQAKTLEESLASSRKTQEYEREEAELLRRKIALRKADADASKVQAKAAKESAAEQKKAEEDLDALVIDISKRRADYQDYLLEHRKKSGEEHAEWELELAERQAEWEDKQLAEMEGRVEAVASTISSGISQAWRDVESGAKTTDEAVKDMFLGWGKAAMRAATEFVIAEGIKQLAKRLTATVSSQADSQATQSTLTNLGTQVGAELTAGGTKIGVAAGVAGAKGAESASSLPFPYNLIAAAAAAASLFALVMSFKKFHSGGVVDGPSMNLPGLKMNEVPAVLERGEVVLTKEEASIRQQGGAARGPSVSVNFNSVMPATTAEAMRAARGFNKTLALSKVGA